MRHHKRTYSLRSSVSVHRVDRRNDQRKLRLEYHGEHVDDLPDNLRLSMLYPRNQQCSHTARRYIALYTVSQKTRQLWQAVASTSMV